MKTYGDLLKQITLDKELMQEFRTVARKTKDHPEAFVAWAKEKGYTIAIEELLEDSPDLDEIADEELETVTGGAKTPSIKRYKPSPGGGLFYCSMCRAYWYGVSEYWHNTHWGEPPKGCPGPMNDESWWRPDGKPGRSGNDYPTGIIVC